MSWSCSKETVLELKLDQAYRLDEQRRCICIFSADMELRCYDWVRCVPLMLAASLNAFIHRPILGGLLSNPETQWPDSLGRIPYLRSHPYFLSCLIAALFSFVVYVVTFLTLKEVRFAVILLIITLSDAHIRPYPLLSLKKN